MCTFFYCITVFISIFSIWWGGDDIDNVNTVINYDASLTIPSRNETPLQSVQSTQQKDIEQQPNTTNTGSSFVITEHTQEINEITEPSKPEKSVKKTKLDRKNDPNYQILRRYIDQGDKFLLETKTKLDFVIQAADTAYKMYRRYKSETNDPIQVDYSKWSWSDISKAIHTVMTTASNLLPLSDEDEQSMRFMSIVWEELNEEERLYLSALLNMSDLKEISAKAGGYEGEHICFVILGFDYTDTEDSTEKKEISDEERYKQVFKNWCNKNRKDTNTVLARREALLADYPEYYDLLLIPMLKAGKNFDDLLSMVKKDHKRVLKALQEAKHNLAEAKNIINLAKTSINAKKDLKIFDNDTLKKLELVFKGNHDLMSEQERSVIQAISYEERLNALIDKVQNGTIKIDDALSIMEVWGNFAKEL